MRIRGAFTPTGKPNSESITIIEKGNIKIYKTGDL